eukprot:symbB.v1.2.037196.t1/scaffold5424.1/size27344/4
MLCVWWRSRSHPESNVFFGIPPLRGAGAPKGRNDETEESICGLRSEVKSKRTFSGNSRAQQLSPSGCVWLLENVCIEDRKIVLFGRESEVLPRKLLACGEFGNFEFNAVERKHPASRHLYPRNSSEVDTLVIAGALASGTSLHNPFHVMHTTIPLVWQLHHPDYGLCIPRSELDIRLAFYSAFHARRQVHFWKAFSRDSGDLTKTELIKTQRLVIPAQWRFWWGPLSEMPPLPLGADKATKCYPRVIFGRELLRTGLGGFVTPRVVNFYHQYLAKVFAMVKGEGVESSIIGEFDGELKIYHAMGTGSVRRHDSASLSKIAPGSQMDLNYFTPDGFKHLTQPPAMLPLETKEGEVIEVDEDEVRFTQSAAANKKALLRNVNLLWVQRPRRASRWIANMEEADILVGVTGAAMAWGAFMHKDAAILDLFPPGSKFCNEGWGSNSVSHYGGLARLSGMQYTCMEHPAALHGSETPMSQQEALYLADKEVKEKLGGYWHGQNVRLDMPKFQKIFLEAVDKVLPVLPTERITPDG